MHTRALIGKQPVKESQATCTLSSLAVVKEPLVQSIATLIRAGPLLAKPCQAWPKRTFRKRHGALDALRGMDRA